MVWPMLIAAGIGAAGSLGSGLMGANAASDAADTNWQIALMNYYQRERERNEMMNEARINKKENQLGMTDARGTRTQFKPGEGWVTTLAPDQLELAKLQDQEQRNVLTKDLPMRRAGMGRNYQRSLQEEAVADMFRRQMQNTRMGSDRAIEGDLYKSQTQGLRDAHRDESRNIFGQMMRTQNSNVGDVISKLSKEHSDQYSKAALNARLQSRGLAEKEYTGRREGLANLYNLFAGRAQQLPDVSYKPQAVDKAANDQMYGLGQRNLAAGNALATAAGSQGGRMDYIQPNYGMANAVGGGAAALASAFRAYPAMQGLSAGGVTGFGSANAGRSGGRYVDPYQNTESPTQIW